MQELQYFYSKTGTVSGPVSMSVLKKLIREKVIDSSCYLCREGDDKWEPLNPDFFQGRPRLPIPQPKKITRPRRKRDSWYSATRLMDPHIRRNLNIITWMSIFVGGAAALHLRFVDFAASQEAPESPLEVVVYFVVASSAVGVMGYLFSLVFAESHRRLGRAIGMFFFAVILSVLYYVFLALQVSTVPVTPSADEAFQVTPSN